MHIEGGQTQHARNIGEIAASTTAEVTPVTLFDSYEQTDRTQTITAINEDIRKRHVITDEIRRKAMPFYIAFATQLTLHNDEGKGMATDLPAAPLLGTPEYTKYVNKYSENIEWKDQNNTPQGPHDYSYRLTFLPTTTGPLLQKASVSIAYQEESHVSSKAIDVTEASTLQFDNFGNLVSIGQEAEAKRGFGKSHTSRFQLDLQNPLTFTQTSFGEDQTYTYDSGTDAFVNQAENAQGIDKKSVLGKVDRAFGIIPTLPN
jgi:hypothetical protein